MEHTGEIDKAKKTSRLLIINNLQTLFLFHYRLERGEILSESVFFINMSYFRYFEEVTKNCFIFHCLFDITLQGCRKRGGPLDFGRSFTSPTRFSDLAASLLLWKMGQIFVAFSEYRPDF